MTTKAESNTIGDIGDRIRKARELRGLSQEQLGSPRFTEAYVVALERGSLRPSLKALEYLASNLQLPLSQLLPPAGTRTPEVRLSEAPTETDLRALQEDLSYQYTYARMLIRGGSIRKALELVKIAEAGASPYTGCLPSRLVFRPPFLRGMAHLRCTDPAPAVAELRHALILAGEDPLAQTVVRNLLGVSYYLLARPIEALRQHLHCFEAVEQDIAKDLSLRQNILRNLANDYWALNDVTQAICTYRKALRIASDLNDAGNQAYLFWALAMAYRAANDQSLAKFYARRGIRLYEELDQHSNTALVSLQLIELLLREDKYDEVEELLAKTETNLSGTGNNVLLCKLHYNRADLLRRRGHLERAAQEAEHALALIRQDPEQHRSRKRKPVVYSQLHIVRTHAMALRAAALVAEAQGHQDRADTFFTRAAGLAGEIELIELVHTIAFSYADVLKARSNYKSAVEHYRLAARSAPGMVRPHI